MRPVWPMHRLRGQVHCLSKMFVKLMCSCMGDMEALMVKRG